MSFGTQIPIATFSSFINNVERALLLKEPQLFFVNELSRSVRIIIIGMSGTSLDSNGIPAYGGTYLKTSSLINIGNITSVMDTVSVMSLAFIETILL